MKFPTTINLLGTLACSCLVLSSQPAIAGPGSHAAAPGNLIERLPDAAAERFVTSLSATQAVRAMDNGTMTSEQYVNLLLQRIERHAGLNAVIEVDRDQVLDAARAADQTRAAGLVTGPLHGVPFLVKDSINTANLATTLGTPALAGFIPDENADVVRAMIDAGAIVLGKTNLHELQAGYTTNNPFTGATLNPYDLARSPGGSSGGNGAALAARLAPIALGADTAGSVRVPAALNGVAGFRPTSGRYPKTGISVLSATLDTVGPMARSVADLALADAILSGSPPGLDSADLTRLRIGVPHAHFRELIDPRVGRALDQLVERLRSSGVEIIEADIPGVGDATQQAALAISIFESVSGLTEYLAVNDTGVSLSTLASMVASPDVAFLLSQAITNPVPEQVYEQILFGLRPLLIAIYLDYIDSNQLDAVIFPSNPVPAPELGAMTVAADGDELPIFDAFFRLGHYTPLIGAPTLSLPMGQLPDGLPVGGVDIAGAPGDDRRILRIGVAVERLMPRIRPPKEIEPTPIGHWAE